MTTYPTTSALYEVSAKLPIPLEKRAYFHARLSNRIYALVLNKFLEREKSENLTQAELGRRIGKRPEVINRLLGAPGNWTLETISDLLLGIAAEELDPASSPLLNRAPRNMRANDFLRHIQNENGNIQGRKESQESAPPIDPVSMGLAEKPPVESKRLISMAHEQP